MFSVAEHGSLAVVWEHADTRKIDRELKQIDERLFLDPEHDGHRLYYTVKFWNGERAVNPVTLLVDWRDRYGAPKPLTEQIVDEIRRMIRRGPIDTVAVAAANEQLKRDKKEEAFVAAENIATDFERHGRKAHLVHRSQGLRRSRDRMRRRGENV